MTAGVRDVVLLARAIEPGSYVRPHRHLSPPKAETFVAIWHKLFEQTPP